MKKVSFSAFQGRYRPGFPVLNRVVVEMKVETSFFLGVLKAIAATQCGAAGAGGSAA